MENLIKKSNKSFIIKAFGKSKELQGLIVHNKVIIFRENNKYSYKLYNSFFGCYMDRYDATLKDILNRFNCTIFDNSNSKLLSDEDLYYIA